MTPKWQKSLSAMEIDYDDCCTLHSSWGDGSDRCCFSSTVEPMQISLMPVYHYWIQKPRSENKSIIAWKAALPLLEIPTPAGSSLSFTHTVLLAFSSVSHLLALLLITVRDLNDPAQWAANINAQFLPSQPQCRLSGPLRECQRLIRLENAIYQGLELYKRKYVPSMILNPVDPT